MPIGVISSFTSGFAMRDTCFQAPRLSNSGEPSDEPGRRRPRRTSERRVTICREVVQYTPIVPVGALAGEDTDAGGAVGVDPLRGQLLVSGHGARPDVGGNGREDLALEQHAALRAVGAAVAYFRHGVMLPAG